MFRVIAVWTVAGILLTGCLGIGGGGDSKDEDPGNPALTDNEKCLPITELPENQKRAVGIYTGKMVTDGTAHDTYALFGADGHFEAFSAVGVAYGEIGGSSDNLIGSGTYMDALGTGTNGLALTGSFQPQQKVNVAIQDELAFALDLEYAAPMSKNCMETGNFASTYSNAHNGYSETTTITISETGHVDGSITSGCVISGQIKSYGVEGGNFSITYDVSSCPAEIEALNGEFTGQGSFGFSDDGIAEALVLLAHSKDSFMTSGYRR